MASSAQDSAQAQETLECLCPVPGRIDIDLLNKQISGECHCKIHGFDHSSIFVEVNAELVARRRATARAERLKRETEERKSA